MTISLASSYYWERGKGIPKERNGGPTVGGPRRRRRRKREMSEWLLGQPNSWPREMLANADGC
jgi:hypothetical protein